MLKLDTHIDIPWDDLEQGRNARSISDGCDAQGRRIRKFSLKDARLGGLSGACLAAYVPQGDLTERGYSYAHKRLNDMLEAIYDIPRIASTDGYEARICTNTAEIRTAYREGAFAVIPCIENLFGAELGNLRAVCERFKPVYATLTHNLANQWGTGCREKNPVNDGLSAQGVKAVEILNECKVAIDISHATKKTAMDAMRYSQSPVLATHSGARAIYDHVRNLDDEQLAELDKTGGMVNIVGLKDFLSSSAQRDDRDYWAERFSAHLFHLIKHIGIDKIGIGSDFDGGGGFAGFETAADYPHLDEVMRKAGLDESERRAVWGENFLNFLDRRR